MIRKRVQTYVENAKKAYSENNLDIAAENWNKIYDELEDEDLRSELFETMSKFTNNEVFGITEHLKIISHYYS